MSARAMITPLDPQSPETKTRAQRLLTNGLAQGDALGTPAAEQSLSPEDDSARFAEELELRYGAPYPLPWPHGGLNE